MRRHKLRTIVLTLLVAFLIPTTILGVSAWRIVEAIDRAQDQVVVDLPESTIETAGILTAGTATPVASPVSVATPASTPTTATDPSSLDIALGVIGTGSGVNAPDPATVWPGKTFLNILLLGVDTRTDGGDQNADVIIIARLNLATGTMSSVSLPRDLLVEIPGYGAGKINGAYNVGVTESQDDKAAGVAKVRDTIAYNFGIEIDEYVLIDFQGFEQVIDAVGGIDIDVPEAIHDEEYPTEDYGTEVLDIAAGYQHMDGELALKYARTRHGDSDDQRRERQQLVMYALFEKAKSIGSLTKAAQSIAALSGAVQTSLHFDEQLALARIALDTDRSQIAMASVVSPLVEGGTTADGLWVYQGDPAAIAAYIEDVLATAEP